MAFTLSHSPAHNGYLYFQITNGYDAVYNWFNALKQTGHYIIDYTIMTNHVHVVIAFHNTSKTITSIIVNGKRL